MKRVSILYAIVVGFLILEALVLVLPVHAAGPTVNNRAGTDVTAFTSITSVSIGPLLVSNAGDVLIVEFPIFFNIDSAGSGPCPCDPVTSITDTQGLTWTRQVSTGPIATSYSSSSNTDCHLDNCQMAEMWSATTTSTTTTTIVVHFQSSKIEGAFGAEDAQGIVQTPVASAFCYLSANCGTYSTTTGHPFTTTTNDLVNGELVVSAIGTQSGSYCAGGGSQTLIVDSSASPNWSTITGQINPAGNLNGVQGCDVYGFTSSAVSGFAYPWNTAAGGTVARFALIGAIFSASGPNVSPIVTTITTITTITIFSTVTVAPQYSPSTSLANVLGNQLGFSIAGLVPTLIIVGALVFLFYEAGFKDEKIISFVMTLAFGICSVAGLIPIYIPIFIGITLFLVIIGGGAQKRVTG